MRDRLIELLMNTPKLPITKGGRAQGKTYQTAGNIADYLLANGVIVPPCKVGDVVYCCGRGKVEGFAVLIIELAFTADGFKGEFVANNGEYPLLFEFENVGKTVFLTREEAERALKGGVE